MKQPEVIVEIDEITLTNSDIDLLAKLFAPLVLGEDKAG